MAELNDSSGLGLHTLKTQHSIEREYTLESLHHLTNRSLFSRGPLVFILMLLAMLGVTVNVIVMVVFLKRFPACALRTFIVSMAVADFTTTGAGIPLHLYLLLQGYYVKYEICCRVFYTINALTTNMSGFIIVLFAVDRLRRVTSPSFKEYDTIRSYYQIATVLGLSLIVTVPFIPLIGIRHQTIVDRKYKHLRGEMCWIKDDYVDGLYHLIYRLVLVLIFLINVGILVRSYFSIGHSIHVLAKEFKEELLYRYLHPPIKRFPHFYDEDPVKPTPGSENNEDLGFAGKLHGVHGSSPDVEKGNIIQTASKKFSTVILNILGSTDSPEPQSSSQETKISQDVTVREDLLSPTKPHHYNVPENTIVGNQSSEAGLAAILRPGWMTSIFPKKDSKQQDSKQQDSKQKAAPESIAQVPNDDGNINQSADVDEKLEKEIRELEQKAEQEGLLPLQKKSVRITSTTKPPTEKKSRARIRKSTRTRVRGETMQTLNQLEKIKRNSTKTMTLLTLAYIFTWVPYVIARVIQKVPVNMCTDLNKCWLNWSAYSMCSIYINCTINPFLYCFGSVHFRKQCKLMIKPYQDRFCKEKARKRRKTVKTKKDKTVKEESPKDEDPKPNQA